MNPKVFLSSTFTDLADHRHTVSNAIRQLGAQDISMEDFGARDERPAEECLRLVREESDIFVGIYAHKYGHVPPNSRQSIVEMEYHAATEAALPRFIYLIDARQAWLPEHIDDGTNRKRLDAFKKTLLQSHICQKFGNPDDLATKVVADLGRHMAMRSVMAVAPCTPSLPNIAHESFIPNDKRPHDWNLRRQGIYDDHRGVFLTHVAKPSKQPDQVCDIYIYLIRHKSVDFSDVKLAEFFLGPYWGNTVFPVAEQNGVIGISTAAFGTFLCICRVTFKDGKQVFLERYIDFETPRDG
jgi:hypothetical protein